MPLLDMMIAMESNSYATDQAGSGSGSETQSQSDCRVVVNIDGFAAVSCTRAFWELLGYRSQRSCLRALRTVAHFKEHNLLQIYSLARSRQSPRVTIVDSHAEPVGELAQVGISQAKSLMFIEIEPQSAINQKAHAALNSEFLLDPRSSIHDSPQNTERAMFCLDKREMVCSADWAQRFGIEDLLESNGSDAWFDCISPEHRTSVKVLMQHPDLPSRHTLYYSVVDKQGVVRKIAHLIDILGSGPGRRLDSHFTVCLTTQLEKVALKTIELDSLPPDVLENRDATSLISAADNQTIELPSYTALKLMLSAIQERLAGDNRHAAIRVQKVLRPEHCSLCDDPPDFSGSSIELRLMDLELSRGQLKLLAEVGVSPFRLGRDDSWQVLLREIHRLGFHVLLGRSSDQRVTLTLTGSSGPRG